MDSLAHDRTFFEQSRIYMRVWHLVFISIIIAGTSLQGKGTQQESRLFAEGDNDPKVIGLSNEVSSKGWIIYSAHTDKGDWDLFLMRPDGSARRNITNTPGFNEAAARFSPDGQKILYYRMPKDVAVDNNKYGIYDLVIADANGANPVVWGNDYNWASWGPEGKRLACLSIKGIRLIDLSTKKTIKELNRRGIVQQLVWSPDGRWFVGTANGLGQYWNIGRISEITGQVNAIGEADRYNCTPDWLADSQHVVYSRGIIPSVGGWAQLWMAGGDGEEKRVLYAEEGRHIYGGCVSPDGKYVLFTRSQQDLGEVDNSLTTMAIIRFQDAPVIAGKNEALRKAYPDANNGPILQLSWGWEPHWTYAAIDVKGDPILPFVSKASRPRIAGKMPATRGKMGIQK
jgi:dipeptidyl aminopeptidase/acylaminoacyl peptidase